MRFCSVLALAGAVLAPCGASAQAEYVSSYTWPVPERAYGGLSGLDLLDDGNRFVAVSDRGYIVTGTLAREDGAITGVSIPEIAGLETTNGAPVSGYEIDAEGLAIGSNGRLYVSFEAKHRVWTHAAPFAPAELLPQHPDFEGLQLNSSLEALAIDENGTLYTLPERSGKLDRPFPVYRFRNGAWDQPFSLPRRGKFLAVGADFGPDGKFYLLERDHTPFFGFRTRVRCFEIDGAEIKGEQTLIETERGTHDNLEGIAVWQDAQGDTRITMLSDNNYQPFQVTEFVDYRLPDALDPLKSNR